METWVLIFYTWHGGWFVGGEYSVKEHCEIAAAVQHPHWKKVFSKHQIFWRCKSTHYPLKHFGQPK